MATERNPRTQTTRPRSGPAPTERQRIPLPPLPQFRGGPSAARPAVPERDRPASGGIGPDEADLLLAGGTSSPLTYGAPGPGHEGRPNPTLDPAGPVRTGESGATVLNDLVDEIERGLEKELLRHAPGPSLPAYRRTLGCSLSPAGEPGPSAPAGSGARRGPREGR